MAKRPVRPAPPLDRDELPWLLAVALATAAPHASHLPLWLSLLTSLVLLWRLWLWRQGGALPGRWRLALIACTVAAGIAWEYRTLLGRDPGVALLVFFMALKPMEISARRDSMVVIMLGFFLLLTHYFYSQSIPTGLWLLASTLLLIATLIRLHGGAQPWRAIVRYAALLLLQSAPFMLILFLLFPRVQGPLWGLPQDAYSGLSGLSERMSPGSLNNLIQSGAIAFRAEFSGALPEKSELYWRGPVFLDYDGQTWRARAPYLQPRGKAPAIEAGDRSYHYVITLEAHNLRWLLALEHPLQRPNDSTLTPSLETLAREPVRNRVRYSFASSVNAVANRQESTAMLQQSLRLPPGLNPRSRELAASWQNQFKSAEMISNAALLHFRQEDFFYTLQPPLLGAHAVDEFLFETQSGFCEHFASAYVFLMRAAGVPARVVGGYQGGEINPVDGYLTVRQSDAHAWAEIWLADRGWVRIDPTAAVAPSRIERGIEAALPADDPLPALIRIDADWLRDLRNRWEAANNAWNQWVLGYNPQRQREMLGRIGFKEADWREMSAVMAILCAITLLGVTLWTLLQRRRETPAQRLWRQFCQRLARLGMPRAAWEGPLAFAARVSRQRPELGALGRRAANHYAALHYGHGEARDLQALKDCVRHARRWKLP
jgi:transglutaminase-like putative cysteine protease